MIRRISRVLASCWHAGKLLGVKMTTKQKKEVPEDIHEALLRFTRQEPEAVANLLALLASDFKVELVIHEHKAAAENGVDPGERQEWSIRMSSGMEGTSGSTPDPFPSMTVVFARGAVPQSH